MSGGQCMRRMPQLPALVAVLFAIALAYTTADASATVAPASYGGPPGTLGTEFWFAFGANDLEGVNYVSISAATATTATVAVPALGFSTDVSISAGQTTTVELPLETDLKAEDGVENLAVHVTAAAPVSVYGLEDSEFTTDGFTALPVTALGVNYYILGYEAPSGEQPQAEPSDFQVIGTEDDTTVTITPSAATASHEAGVPFTVDLNAGQTYQLIGVSGGDLSGTYISSSAPVSVLAGAECANIPSLSYEYCNYIAEQMPPTTEWGTEFLTEPLATRTKGDTFRILASQADTTVAIDGTTVDTLEAGHFYQAQLTEGSTIVASKPTLVAQYSDSSSFDEIEATDPSETVVPPTAQFLDSYTYATPPSRFTNYVNVIAPNGELSSLLLDGSAIPSGDFTAIGSSGFSGAQIPVEAGTHTLQGSLAFGITAYGFALSDAYSYTGGYAQSARVEEATVKTQEQATSTKPEAAAPPPASPPEPTPILGQRETLQLVSGTVTVRLEGTTRFVPFSGTGSLADGSEVEAANGRVLLTVATLTPGQTQSAEVHGGRFLIHQADKSPAETHLTLSLPLTGCPRTSLLHGSASALLASVTHRPGKKSRHLWVSEKGGSWGTNGRYVSTTVEGTHWLTLDECDESRVSVLAGKVKVRNLLSEKTKVLTAGETYVAALR